MPQQRQILIFENSYSLTNFFIKHWIELTEQYVGENGLFSAAISGDRTFTEFYCKLSGIKDFDLWHKTHIFLTNEKFVSLDDQSSHYRMINDNLLSYVNIPQHNIHPISTEQENIAIAAEEYKHQLQQFFKLKTTESIPRFDVVLLTVGTDGHVASLYPNDDVSEDSGQLTVAVSSAHLRNERISLSLPVINSAQNIIFCILGKNKADICQKIFDPDCSLPASKVLPTNGKVTFLLDKNAASKIAYQDEFSHFQEAILLRR